MQLFQLSNNLFMKGDGSVNSSVTFDFNKFEELAGKKLLGLSVRIEGCNSPLYSLHTFFNLCLKLPAVAFKTGTIISGGDIFVGTVRTGFLYFNFADRMTEINSVAGAKDVFPLFYASDLVELIVTNNYLCAANTCDILLTMWLVVDE